jgi:hypothetical protein
VCVCVCVCVREREREREREEEEEGKGLINYVALVSEEEKEMRAGRCLIRDVSLSSCC